MRLSVLLLLITVSNLFATNPKDKDYHLSHLDFSYTYNNGMQSDKMFMYLEGVTQILNTHIQKRIKEKKLSVQKFNIRISSNVFGKNSPVYIQQDSIGYISVPEDHKVEELMRMVDYFTLETWKPIKTTYDGWPYEDMEDLEKQLEKGLEVTKKIYGDYQYSPLKMWESAPLSILFKEGELTLKHEKGYASKEFYSCPPVVLGDKYLIVQKDSIRVFENNKQINAFHYFPFAYFPCYVKIKGKGRMVHLNGTIRLFAVYSFDENQFFTVKKEEGK